MLAVVGVLIAMAVVVAKVASRQHMLHKMEHHLRHKQKKMKKKADHDRAHVKRDLRGIKSDLREVEEDVNVVDERSQAFQDGKNRNLIRVDSSTAALSSVAPPVPSTSTTSVTSTVEKFEGDSKKKWTYVTNADGSKLLSGGVVANTFAAEEGIEVRKGCVKLPSGATLCSGSGDASAGAAIEARSGGGGITVFSDGTSSRPAPRSGHAVGIDVFVPAKSTSWYKVATVPVTLTATFQIQGVVSHAGASHDLNALITSVESRDSVVASITSTSASASAPVRSGDDEVDADSLWKVFGIAVVYERAAASSETSNMSASPYDKVHLYLKAAPNAATGLAIALTLTAMGDVQGTRPVFSNGAAPLSLAFTGNMTASVDATLSGGTIGQTVDVASHPSTRFVRLASSTGALQVDGGAKVVGRGLIVADAVDVADRAMVGTKSNPAGVVTISKRLKVGHNDDSGFMPMTALSVAQGDDKDAVGASFKSNQGTWSHFPWSNGRTYVRAGAPTNGGIHIGDLGATEVQVAQSWFSRAEADRATQLRAGASDKLVLIGDDAKSPGGVVLSTKDAAPTVVNSALEVKGGAVALSSGGITASSDKTVNKDGHVSVYVKGKERLRVKGDGTGVQILGGSLQVCDDSGNSCKTLGTTT